MTTTSCADSLSPKSASACRTRLAIYLQLFGAGIFIWTSRLPAASSAHVANTEGEGGIAALWSSRVGMTRTEGRMYTIRLRGGVNSEILRARAARLRQSKPARPPLPAVMSDDDDDDEGESGCHDVCTGGSTEDRAGESGDGGGECVAGGCGEVEERMGRLHCMLRGENITISLADLDAPVEDWEGAPSLLFVAAAEGHGALVRALVNHGATVELVNEEVGCCLCMYAYAEGCSFLCSCARTRACARASSSSHACACACVCVRACMRGKSQNTCTVLAEIFQRPCPCIICTATPRTLHTMAAVH